MLTDSGSGGGPLGRATFQNIASRLRETPTFEKARVSPRQNRYFRSGRPSLRPAQAQWANKMCNTPLFLDFFLTSKLVQAATGSDGRPWALKQLKKPHFSNVFSTFDGKTNENIMFFFILLEPVGIHIPPLLNVRAQTVTDSDSAGGRCLAEGQARHNAI
jgi:hypothetical protein